MKELLLILLLLVQVYLIWLAIRVNKVYEFELKILDLCYNWSIGHLGEESAFVWCYPKYKNLNNKMVFSFKPLKLEYWISKEDLDKLNN